MGEKAGRSAMMTLSRSSLALQGESAAVSSGLWPAVRNTRFFADRLSRLKVEFHHLQVPADGAFVSDAAARLEGDDIIEQGLDLAPTEIFVRSVSAYKTVTKETVEDFGNGIQGVLIQSLLQAVMMRIDAQIIAGDGIEPNVLGVRNWTGISSQSKSSDTTLVAAAKAAEKIYQAGYTPDLILMNPADWLAAVTTAAVDPFAVGSKMLGIDVFVTEASPSGLPTVMDSSCVFFLERSPINVMMSNTNDDDWTNNRVTFRAQQSVGVVVTDLAAVAKVVA